jgi:uncharacterized membrane protein YfcA
MELTIYQAMAIAAAPLFGLGFNALVEYWEKHQVDGETALWVVIGVAVTIVMSVPLIGLVDSLTLGCFFVLTDRP